MLCEFVVVVVLDDVVLLFGKKPKLGAQEDDSRCREDHDHNIIRKQPTLMRDHDCLLRSRVRSRIDWGSLDEVAFVIILSVCGFPGNLPLLPRLSHIIIVRC